MRMPTQTSQFQSLGSYHEWRKNNKKRMNGAVANSVMDYWVSMYWHIFHALTTVLDTMRNTK
jgi:hypothetical protein